MPFPLMIINYFIIIGIDKVHPGEKSRLSFAICGIENLIFPLANTNYTIDNNSCIDKDRLGK